MTNVDQVSIENKNTIESTGVASKTAAAILNVLSTGAATTSYIASLTGIKVLTVRPAMTKLLKGGKVVKAGRVKHDSISENLFALAA